MKNWHNKRMIGKVLGSILLVILPSLLSAQENSEPTYITEPYVTPYKQHLGFSFNALGVSSMTFEGRFFWGFARNFSLIVSPSYQNTIELPFYHVQREEMAFFDIRRLNLGLGARAHFYEYDSKDGWYIEALGRPGLTWIGQDDYYWSVTPSLMVGYETVYDYGYTVGFGMGLEWEFLLKNKSKLGYHADYLTSAYFVNVTKIPLMAELSLGWLWW